MRLVLYSIWYNEAKMAPYWLRHYTPWVDKLIVWVDPATNDGSREMLQKNPKVEVREWPHKTGLDDQEFINTVNHWPSHEGRKLGAEWVGFVDADEFLWAPDYNALLRTDKTDAIRSKGYALISPFGLPKDDGRQIYEQVKTGVRQDNHDKFLIWRPGFDIGHHHGRHDVPSYGGRLNMDYMMKNFHAHHIEGVSATKERNQRNYERAKDKVFAWNYSKESEQKGIGGTAFWVERSMGELFDVVQAEL